jgi:hypothetical protein
MNIKYDEKDEIETKRYMILKYDQGIMVKRDFKIVKESFEFIINKTNEIKDIYLFAILLYNEKDYETSIKYYKMASKLGDAKSMYKVGYMYENGLGVQQYYSIALEWYKKAFENGIDKAKDKIENIEKMFKLEEEKNNFEKLNLKNIKNEIPQTKKIIEETQKVKLEEIQKEKIDENIKTSENNLNPDEENDLFLYNTFEEILLTEEEGKRKIKPTNFKDNTLYYQKAIALFQNKTFNQNFSIIKVFLIVNHKLINNYVNKRNQLTNLRNIKIKEEFLFHATSEKNIESIIKNGFSLKYFGSGADKGWDDLSGFYGIGVLLINHSLALFLTISRYFYINLRILR